MVLIESSTEIFQHPPDKSRLIIVPDTAPFQVLFNSKFNLFTCGICGHPLGVDSPTDKLYYNIWRHFTIQSSPHYIQHHSLKRRIYMDKLKSCYTINKSDEGD